jgi:hypothetical protein
MGYEVWIFDSDRGYAGGLVAVETPPTTYSLADVEHWAVMLQEEYRSGGMTNVSTLVRKEAGY